MTLSTAAGTIFKPTIEAIDQQLSDISSRYMFLEGDQDKLLDARLQLMAERDAKQAGGK